GARAASARVPGLRAACVDLARAIRTDSGGGLRHARLRSAFLIAQVSMSVVLLGAAGRFIRGFHPPRTPDTGLDAGQILTASIDLETRSYSAAQGSAFLRELISRLEAAPGILAVNAVDIVPVTLSNRTADLLREGDAEPTADRPPATPPISSNSVGPR